MSAVVTVNEAHTRGTEAGVIILDVREDHEWISGHVEGAVHIPLRDLPDRIAELPEGKEILCFCRSGNRSRKAADFLVAQGRDAANIDGGVLAWEAADLPLAY